MRSESGDFATDSTETKKIVKRREKKMQCNTDTWKCLYEQFNPDKLTDLRLSVSIFSIKCLCM